MSKLIPKKQTGWGKLEYTPIKWNAEEWLSRRVPKPDGTKYTNEDVEIFNSHIPEYEQIEKDSRQNGTWLKMPDGSTWKGDPKIWVIMQSKNFKKNYQSTPYYTGQKGYQIQYDFGKGPETTTIAGRAPYYNGRMWFSDNEDYGNSFAYYYDIGNNHLFKHKTEGGKNFISAIPKVGNYRMLNNTSKYPDTHYSMPYEKVDNNIIRLDNSKIELNKDRNQRLGQETLTIDDIANWSKELGDDGLFVNKVYDGDVFVPNNKVFINKRTVLPKFNQYVPTSFPEKPQIKYSPTINEFISQPGFTNKIKFIEGNNGNFDINNSYKYSMNTQKKKLIPKYDKINS